MKRVVLHRVLIAVPVLLVVSVLTFVLISFLPGNAGSALLGPTASPQQVAALNAQLGLNGPLFEQYWTWLGRLVHGNLGMSLANSQAVTGILNTRLPVTLILVISTTLVSSLIGIPLGFYSAIRGGRSGRVLQVFTFIGYALPGFWVALSLVALFAVKWHLLPPNGYVPPQQSAAGWVRSLVLPVTALSIGGITGIAAQTRDSTLDVLGRDFVRVQFANGLSRRSIAWKHVLRNAAPPIINLIGIIFVGLLAGAVLIEQIFDLPGLGSEIVTATTNHDIPVIQGAVLYFTVIVLVVNLLLDLINGWADPRVRVK